VHPDQALPADDPECHLGWGWEARLGGSGSPGLAVGRDGYGALNLCGCACTSIPAHADCPRRNLRAYPRGVCGSTLCLVGWLACSGRCSPLHRSPLQVCRLGIERSRVPNYGALTWFCHLEAWPSSVSLASFVART
jgi:hypothetical protein